MPRLIWVFAGHPCHFVGFVMRRLKCWLNIYCKFISGKLIQQCFNLVSQLENTSSDLVFNSLASSAIFALFSSSLFLSSSSCRFLSSCSLFSLSCSSFLCRSHSNASRFSREVWAFGDWSSIFSPGERGRNRSFNSWFSCCCFRLKIITEM